MKFPILVLLAGMASFVMSGALVPAVDAASGESLASVTVATTFVVSGLAMPVCLTA
ncbi:MAG: hypothetical protein GYA46_01440, partial [candidate division Zixibacteria bacterium]|nr:hypothetical protein [candidate division Zixibacteria bacterium]